MPAESLNSKETQARITLELKRIGTTAVARLMAQNTQVPENCPIIYFDTLTDHLVIADMWIRYLGVGFSHRLSNIMLAKGPSATAEYVDDLIHVFDQHHIMGTPLICDEQTLGLIAKTEGTVVLGKMETPFDVVVQRPGGIIAVCLPDPETFWVSIPGPS
ncbi:hypothetical protein HY948_01740 [Candidatus Gottesmanbacteria bacterium]|nr:hypothetical protein [Candidatus Gottesmanbacteria bacterium]